MVRKLREIRPRFSTTELVILIGACTIFLFLFLTAVVGIWRPMRMEVVNHIYSLLSKILTLIAGLLGGGAVGYSLGKAEANRKNGNGNASKEKQEK